MTQLPGFRWKVLNKSGFIRNCLRQVVLSLWKHWLLSQFSSVERCNISRELSWMIWLYGFYLYWIVIWQSSIVGVLVFPTQIWGWVLVMWSVSFRPVQIAIQGSEERGAADRLCAHLSHCWWSHQNSSLGAAEKRPGAEKVQKPRKES